MDCAAYPKVCPWPRENYHTRYASYVPHIAKLIPRRNHSWVEITTSCGKSIKLPLGDVPHTIQPGEQVESSAWQVLCQKSEYAQLYDKAVRALGRREQFARELKQKLMLKSQDSELIERVIAHCEERGYLDEKRAAEQLVYKFADRGGVGIQRVKSELFRCGCPAELIPWALDLAEELIDETSVLDRLLDSRRKAFQTKLARLRNAKTDGLTPAQAKRQISQKLSTSVMTFLMGRGFKSGPCRSKVRELVDEILNED